MGAPSSKGAYKNPTSVDKNKNKNNKSTKYQMESFKSLWEHQIKLDKVELFKMREKVHQEDLKNLTLP